MAWDNKGENKDATFKEQMLAKVRNALIERQEALFKDIDKRTETWVPIKEEDGTAITFVQNFKEHGGIFIYLESEAEFAECIRQLAPENGWEPIWCTSPKMKQMLSKYGVPFTDSKEREPKQKLVSLTGCECLVAQTGSIVLSDATDQIVPGMRTAFQTVKRKYAKNKPSQMTVITGPSRSTDIEQTLVIGASGIRQVAVFLVDEE